jgi:hypothetical protein
MPFLQPEEMLHGEAIPGSSGRCFHAEQMTLAHDEIE